MSQLSLCAVCHAATSSTTRLVSGSLVARVRASKPVVTDEHIDTHLCPECMQAAAMALDARIGQNAGVALAVDYVAVLPIPPREDAADDPPAPPRKRGSRPRAVSVAA